MVQKIVWYEGCSPKPPTQQLQESVHADVAVVGAGYTGLSAALAVAEQSGSVVVLEQAGLGEGASGMNGGQLIPGLKPSATEVADILGRPQAETILALASDCVSLVERLVARYQIACQLRRDGWIQAASSKTALSVMAQRVQELNQQGGNDQLLDAEEVRSLIGCRDGQYFGGWLNRRAGSLHPLNYLYGLAKAAQSLGAAIYTDSRVAHITKQGDGWRIELAHGPVVTARQVLICTNAYSSNLWPDIHKTIIPATSMQIATDPLPAELQAEILPHGQAVSESKRVMNYYRVDPAGRFIFGGRGPFREQLESQHYSGLVTSMHHLFPQLQHMEIKYQWAGKVAITADYLPHIHEPAAGLSIALGCNGRGVGLMTALGRALGQRAIGGHQDFPFDSGPLRPLPLHRLHKLYASGLIQYYRLLDRLA